MTEKLLTNNQENLGEEWNILTAENTPEKHDNSEEITKSFNILCDNLEIEPTESNIKALNDILIAENNRQKLFEQSKSVSKWVNESISKLSNLENPLANSSQSNIAKFIKRKSLKNTVAKTKKQIDKLLYDEWNYKADAERIRKSQTDIIGQTLFPDELDVFIDNDINNPIYHIELETMRRKILAEPEVEKLGKLSKAYSNSYQSYNEPSIHDVRFPTFEEYRSEKIDKLERRNTILTKTA